MNELKLFIQNKRKLASLIGILLMIAVLPLIIFLTGISQTFFSKASGTWIQLADGNCVTTKSDGTKALKCGTVPLVLFNPFSGSTPSNPNLVKNGSFEDPVLKNTETKDTWQIYGSATASKFSVITPIPGWEPLQMQGGYQVELQRNLYGKSADGNQYAEIDIEGSISLVQKISTTVGKLYTLKFSYSPRPGVAVTDQKLGVYWNGQLIDTIIPTTATTQDHLDWQEHTYTVQATTTQSALGFGSVKGNGSGNFIDKVSVHESADGSCIKRPDIGRSTSMNAEGMLVTLTHATTAALPGNQMQKIDFTSLANGTVTIDGQSHNAAFTYAVPANSTQVQFLIKQVAAGSATTIGLNATDSCGVYPLSFGGGTGVTWPTPSPTPTPAPVRCQPRPNIARSEQMTEYGMFVTLTGATNAGTPNNPLTAVKFVDIVNGKVTISGPNTVMTSGQTYTVPNNANTVSFLISQVTYGSPTTVNILVTDSCGPDYPLFFGGGSGVQWPAPPVACQPPPNMGRPALAQIPGGLRVTRNAGTNYNTPTNFLTGFNMTGFANVRVDYNGHTYKTNTNINLKTAQNTQGVQSITFDVYLINNNQGGTFTFDMVDSCRSIGDFVGSATRATFGAGTPPAELPPP